MSRPLRILGIDPGLQITGYGCVDLGADSDEPELVEAGVLRLKVSESLAYRLAQLHHELLQLLDELQPQRMVVEQLYSHYRHARTSIVMGHARGVVLLAGQERGLAIAELSSTEVKKAITGNGHAGKRQVQLSVMSQCNLAEPPDPPDVADAIAIALCDARRVTAASPISHGGGST
jgi:crossover junction endodeoxyribonuclease RuvC